MPSALSRQWTSAWESWRGETGRAVRKGNFDTDRPTLKQLYGLLNRSGTVQFTRLELPLRFSDRDYALVAAVAVQTKETLARNYGLERFVAVLYPSGETVPEVLDRLAGELARSAIEVLDYRELFNPDADPDYVIDENDRHPSP